MHSSILTLIIGALSLGFIGGSIPGPVLTSILTEIVESSFLRSLRILLWAMVVETTVRLTALLLAGALPLQGIVFQSLSVVGACILLWVARKVWRIQGISASGNSLDLRTLALMIVCNGMLWTYWLTVCVPNAVSLGNLVPSGQYLYLAVFELGWFISTFLVAAFFACFKPLLSHPKVMPLLFKTFSCIFVLFALKMIIGSFQYFHSYFLI